MYQAVLDLFDFPSKKGKKPRLFEQENLHENSKVGYQLRI